MRIGVMTFWWSDDNYGQLLQCYALQKYLRDAGHDAYLIRYDPRNDYVKTPLGKKMLKALNPALLCRFLAWQVKKRARAKLDALNKRREFDVFRDEHIRQSAKTYTSYRELAVDPPDADAYITGSDQVWNPDFLGVPRSAGPLRAFMLDFGSAATKRLAYAASFGKERLDDGVIQKMAPLLKRFEYVSAREQSGVTICRQCGVDAEWVPDPTMLLPAEAYRALYNGAAPFPMPGEPYCLLYMLGNKHEFPVQQVYDWARERGFAVVYVSGNAQYDKYPKTYATIPQWLYLVDHAAYVVTNSFHCGVFSMLFGKKFGVVPLSGEASGMNGRFASLFARFGIAPRFVTAGDISALENPLDEAAVGERLRRLREERGLLERIR
jgi:hypothetical protein